MLGTIKTINELKKLGLIQEYAIGGGYALNYYLESILTYDMDVFIMIDTDEDFRALYGYFREKGHKIENVYIVIDDLPVQFLPSYIGPLFSEAIANARNIEVEGVNGRVFTPEYLVATLLAAYRPKDRIVIPLLLELADVNLVKSIVKRFDSEKTPLYQRLGAILESLQ